MHTQRNRPECLKINLQDGCAEGHPEFFVGMGRGEEADFSYVNNLFDFTKYVIKIES
jgi:hypothetical protein